MLEPNGPLPPEIYRRRRALAIGVGVVVLLLVVWIITSLRDGGDDQQSSDAAAATSSTSASSTSAAPTTTGSTKSSSPSGTAAASGSANPSGTVVASGTSAAAGPTSTVAASGPAGQCPDQSLAVKAAADQPNYKTGQEPGFTIVITNIGTVACERDLGAGLQQVLVYSLGGDQRLWSNTDCFSTTTTDVRTLEPGGQAGFTVKWSGTTSAPGCTAPRNPVAPGAYAVVAQLGALRSTPEPFNIT